MTDITDQEARVLRADAQIVRDYPASTRAAAHLARYILATVDAPEPTLAEELLTPDGRNEDVDGDLMLFSVKKMETLAARAEQMEYDLAEARAKVKRLEDAREIHAHMYREARAEVERLTGERFEKEVRDTIDAHYDNYAAQKDAESNAETPNPADVKEEEPYHIYYGVYGNDHTIGVRIDGKWRCIGDDRGVHVTDTNIARLHHLVPAPRVITDPDELERLAVGTIIRDTRDGLVCQKKFPGFWDTNMGDGTAARDDSPFGPVTVLWEPEA